MGSKDYRIAARASPNPRVACHLPAMDMSYKIDDEGYSEDTRSQDELDSPTPMEPNSEDVIPNSQRLAMDSIMRLGEDERSG